MMRRFIKKIVFISFLAFAINLIIGFFFHIDNRCKAERGVFYPPKRWEEFYNQPKNSIDVIFIGASLCYRGYIPEIYDSITGKRSFNLGSSIQTTQTSYFVLKEALKYQQPDSIYLDLFTRSFTHQGQLESVRYNFNYMKLDKNKILLYLKGLSLKEKFLYLFPAYYQRDQIDRIFRFLFISKRASKKIDKYYGKGYVKSTQTTTIDELLKNNTYTIFEWNKKRVTKKRVSYFFKIIDLCKENNIELILLNAPLPSVIYERVNMNPFEEFVNDVAKSNKLTYNNLNKRELNLNDTIHFKDHHLNYKGAKLTTQYLSNYLVKQKNE